MHMNVHIVRLSYALMRSKSINIVMRVGRRCLCDMADKEVVIRLDEETYDAVCECQAFSQLYLNTLRKICDAIKSATPLEKHDEKVIKETVESIWGKPPCDDAISRQAVIDEIEFWFQRGDYEEALQKVIRNIKDAKSVRPKREKGEWIKTQLGTVCNKCYRFPLLNKDENEILSNYCPYCGADMRTESEARNEQ